ncbi:MAG: ChbG/HpnK family deacetylase, partial [Micromonosporaceae bacterium]|nr:ChbG/HpnK family deacetylase [Micromonosporaceae bacterium]
ITAASLITVAPESATAVAEVRRLGVVPHLHVTLSSERGLPPWRPLSDATSLVDDSGVLGPDPVAVAERAVVADVVGEMDAQLAWLRGQGVAPRAADSHAGVLYGLSGRSLLADTLQWCARHGLAFRLPRDPRPWWGGPLPAPLAAAHEQAVALADSLGVPLPATVVTNRRPAGELGGYAALRDTMLACLAGLPDGTSELFLHPSRADAVPGPAGVVRAWEARLVRDPVWHRAIAVEGIELVSRWWP